MSGNILSGHHGPDPRARSQAVDASMLRMRACGIGLRRILPKSTPGSYDIRGVVWPRPVTFSGPSIRGAEAPISGWAAVMELASLAGSDRVSLFYAGWVKGSRRGVKHMVTTDQAIGRPVARIDGVERSRARPLRRRHQAAGHGLGQDAAQPVRPRPHRAHRHLGGAAAARRPRRDHRRRHARRRALGPRRQEARAGLRARALRRRAGGGGGGRRRGHRPAGAST